MQERAELKFLLWGLELNFWCRMVNIFCYVCLCLSVKLKLKSIASKTHHLQFDSIAEIIDNNTLFFSAFQDELIRAF